MVQINEKIKFLSELPWKQVPIIFKILFSNIFVLYYFKVCLYTVNAIALFNKKSYLILV